MSTNEANVKQKITLVYRDSNGNEHGSYEAACIGQALVECKDLYLESYKIVAIAAHLASYDFKQYEDNAEEAAFLAALAAFEAEEQLHG